MTTTMLALLDEMTDDPTSAAATVQGILARAGLTDGARRATGTRDLPDHLAGWAAASAGLALRRYRMQTLARGRQTPA